MRSRSILMLQLQPHLRPFPSRLMLALSHTATGVPAPVASAPACLLPPLPAPIAPLRASELGVSPLHLEPVPPRPGYRHRTRCFSSAASATADATAIPGSSRASLSCSHGDCCGSGGGSSSDVSDAEWAEVELRLMEMAASKNRGSVSGVRRNEFDLMPVFMQRAGITPERLASLNFIHVAGTKGKGSTCAMVESILRSCGYRTALYTSPHLVDVRERIRVGGKMLPRSEFAAAFRRMYSALRAAADGDDERGPGMPSFFYFITLMAMDALMSRPAPLAPHVVVLEVGIGGRLDATNAVATRGSLAAAAVTSLGFDHMELLGDTLPKIAREKAGIMKAGRPVLVAPQEPDAMRALEEVAQRVGAHLVRPPPLERYSLAAAATDDDRCVVGLGGEHMQVNASLAVALAAEWEAQYGAAEAAAAGRAGAGAAAVEAAAGRPVALMPGGPDPQAAAARAAAVRSLTLPAEYDRGLRSVQWPGRSQVVHDDTVASSSRAGGGGRLSFYLDGAHTPESMAVCAKWFVAEVAAAAEAAEAAEFFGEDPLPQKQQHHHHPDQQQQPSQRHVAVLLFNCMKERDPAVLLPALAAELAPVPAAAPKPRQHIDAAQPQQGQQQQQGQQPQAHRVQVAAAIFTPMLSGGGVLLPAHSGKQAAAAQLTQLQPKPAAPAAPAAVDLSWQGRMQDVWETSAPAAAAGWSEAAVTAAVGGREGGQLHTLPYTSVAESLPQALEAVRAAAAANPCVHVHVLVTGSLYLVGDVLRLLNKPPQ